MCKEDGPVPGEVYYVTNSEGPEEDISNILSYAVYLTYDEYVRFIPSEKRRLPDIKVENLKWKNYFRVVRID